MINLLRAASVRFEMSKLLRDRRGVTALEYGLVAAVLVGTVMVGFGLLANGLNDKFAAIGGSL